MAADVISMATESEASLSGSMELTVEDRNLTDSTVQLQQQWDPLDQYIVILYTIVVPILYGLVSVLGVAGNLLVIYVILAKDGMRTVTNLLLLNLAVADLSFVLVIPPFTAYQFAIFSWPFGSTVCRLMHFLVNVTAYVTVYTLVLIAFVRYLTIVHGQRSARFRTRANVVRTIFSIWVIMVIVNSPVLTSYGVQPTPIGSLECEIAAESVGQRLFATFFIFAYVLPLGIIASLSLCILRHITRHRHSSTLTAGKTALRKQRAGRMLGQVVVVFAVLWLPIHVHLLLSFFGALPESTSYTAVSVLWNCLAYFNSCVNPIIYNRSSAKFRKAFMEVGRCGRMDGAALRRFNRKAIVERGL